MNYMSKIEMRVASTIILVVIIAMAMLALSGCNRYAADGCFTVKDNSEYRCWQQYDKGNSDYITCVAETNRAMVECLQAVSPLGNPSPAR